MKKTAEKKTTGELIMSHLSVHDAATTEELADVAGVSVKDAFSRAWWLSNKDGLLKSKGHGKTRQWALNAKGRKAAAA